MPEIFDAHKKHDDGGLVEVKKLMSGGKFKSYWGSLVVAPQEMRFESQTEGENVIVLGRQHFVTNLGWIALICFAFFVPFFWNEFPIIAEVEDNVHLSLTILWYSALLFFGLQNFLLWFYNVYIVTDERLIDVDFFGLLYKNINVTQIRKVEDVNYSQKGILSSFFNYGDVVIQTASEQRSDEVFGKGGEASPFTFAAISNPDEVVKIISELMEQEEQEEYEGRTR